MEIKKNCVYKCTCRFCLFVCLFVCLYFQIQVSLAAHSVLSSCSICDSVHYIFRQQSQIVLCEYGTRHSVHVCLLKWAFFLLVEDLARNKAWLFMSISEIEALTFPWMCLQTSHKIGPHTSKAHSSRTGTSQSIMTLVVKWCLIKIPVSGGVVGDPSVGVGGGVEVGRTTDIELPSGEPVEDFTEHKPLCLLLATRHSHLSLQLSEVDTADSLLQIVY